MNYDKSALSFAIGFNKKQIEAGVFDGLFDLNVTEKYRQGDTLLHLACNLPSLAIILELCSSNEVDQLVTNNRLKFPFEVVPMNYLTSKKTILHSSLLEISRHFKKKPQIHSIVYKGSQVPIRQETSSVPHFKRINFGNKTISSKHLSMLEKPRQISTEVAEGTSAQKVLSLDVKASKTDMSLLQKRSFINFKEPTSGLKKGPEDRRQTLKNMKLMVRMPKSNHVKKEGAKELIDETFSKVINPNIVLKQDNCFCFRDEGTVQKEIVNKPSQKRNDR